MCFPCETFYRLYRVNNRFWSLLNPHIFYISFLATNFYFSFPFSRFFSSYQIRFGFMLHIRSYIRNQHVNCTAVCVSYSWGNKSVKCFWYKYQKRTPNENNRFVEQRTWCLLTRTEIFSHWNWNGFGFMVCLPCDDDDDDDESLHENYPETVVLSKHFLNVYKCVDNILKTGKCKQLLHCGTVCCCFFFRHLTRTLFMDDSHDDWAEILFLQKMTMLFHHAKGWNFRTDYRKFHIFAKWNNSHGEFYKNHRCARFWAG